MNRNPLYFIARGLTTRTRHIVNDQDESLCGVDTRIEALAVGAHTRRDLDDLATQTTCGTCRRRWTEYESRQVIHWDHAY